MAELDVATARWLTSAPGRAAVTAATTELDEGADELRVADGLVARTGHPERRAAALGAAVARRRARRRWPGADELLFTRAALEQASDPVVSAHRAARLAAIAHEATDPATTGTGPAEATTAEGTLVDLCAGVGGDAVALARAAAGTGAPVLAVDIDAARLTLLAHNAEVLGASVATRHADALSIALPPGAVVHADPSRRRGERRVRRLADHLPSVPALLAAHPNTAASALALSPGVALDDPDLPDDLEVEYVQLGDVLVEATVWLGVSGDGGRARATLLAQDGGVVASRLGRPARRARLEVDELGTVLIEVAPAAVRARLHDEIGAEIDAWRVAEHRALLTSSTQPPSAPWYRARPILAVLPARPKQLRRWLRTHPDATGGAQQVEVVLHGVDADPSELWRALGRPPRGPHGLRMEFVRRTSDTVTVVTR